MPTAPASGGTIISVAAGGNFQSALNSAQPGDVIELAAGATYTGNFVLPNKIGTNWIVIRPSNWTSLPAPGSRMTPTIAAALSLPIIQSTNSSPVLQPAASAHNYRFVGIEAMTSFNGNFGLISTDAFSGQTTLSQVPSDLVFDRMYVHGIATNNLRRCFGLHSINTAVIDSDVRNCHELGSDSQAIAGWNGPGPFKIVNNYLEGAGENIMFGGADPSIANLTPSDIEIRGNHINKPRTPNTSFTVKNLTEFKHAQRVLVEGNIFEGSWNAAQTGSAIIMKTVNQSNTCSWCVTQDITVRYNIIRNVGSIFSFAASPDNNYTDIHARRITITDNLAYNINIGVYTGDSRGFMLGGDLTDMTFTHNTFYAPGHSFMYLVGPAETRMTIRDNASTGGTYGMIGDQVGFGQTMLTVLAPGANVKGNIVAAVGSGTSGYPTGNFYPSTAAGIGFVNAVGLDFRLAVGSAYKGLATDGRDPGADIDAVLAATAAVIVP
jgi:hypothetical protein